MINTFQINNISKTVGKDIFNIKDINSLNEKDQLLYKIAVMQWYVDGEKVEMIDGNFPDNWEEVYPSWDWHNNYYRAAIKRNTKPQYKPYDKPSLNWLGYPVLHKHSKEKRYITNIDKNHITVSFKKSFKISLETLFLDYTWADKSICGEEKNISSTKF